MTGWWWSALLELFGLPVPWLLGDKRRVGFAYAICWMAMWIVYGCWTGQYGFAGGSLIWVGVYGRGWWKWRA